MAIKVRSSSDAVQEAFSFNFGSLFIAICLFFFAFSTILGWNLFGKKSLVIYTLIALAFIILGSCVKSDLVWAFSDFFNYLMVIPNVIGLIALSKLVAEESKSLT